MEALFENLNLGNKVNTATEGAPNSENGAVQRAVSMIPADVFNAITPEIYKAIMVLVSSGVRPDQYVKIRAQVLTAGVSKPEFGANLEITPRSIRKMKLSNILASAQLCRDCGIDINKLENVKTALRANASPDELRDIIFEGNPKFNSNNVVLYADVIGSITANQKELTDLFTNAVHADILKKLDDFDARKLPNLDHWEVFLAIKGGMYRLWSRSKGPLKKALALTVNAVGPHQFKKDFDPANFQQTFQEACFNAQVAIAKYKGDLPAEASFYDYGGHMI